MKKFVEENKVGLLMFCIIILISIISIIYILNNIGREINVYENVLNFSKYQFFSKNNKLQINYLNERSMKVTWKNYTEQDKLYIQLFDESFNVPPSEKYRDLALIPNVKKFKIDFIAYSSEKNINCALFFMQYDNEKLINSEQRVVKVDNTPKLFSLNFPIEKKAKFYKLAIRIMPRKKKWRN